MAHFTQVADRDWITEDVVGKAIERCKMWYGGEGVSASLVNMPENYDLGLHRHETWVTVFLVNGTMSYRGGGEERTISAGDFYFVPPGEEHREKSIDACTVLIIKAEPNIQYPI